MIKGKISERKTTTTCFATQNERTCKTKHRISLEEKMYGYSEIRAINSYRAMIQEGGQDQLYMKQWVSLKVISNNSSKQQSVKLECSPETGLVESIIAWAEVKLNLLLLLTKLWNFGWKNYWNFESDSQQGVIF